MPNRDQRRGGKAGEDQAELEEQQLQEAADRADVDAGEDRAQEPSKSGELPSCSRTTCRTRRCSPNSPRPRPQASDVGRFWPTARPGGRAAREGARQSGRRERDGRADVAADEAWTPTTSSTSATTATGSQRRPVVDWPASGMWFVGPAEPGEIRQRGESRDRVPVAIDDEAGEHERAGDAGRRATSDERRQGERDRAGSERQQDEPERVAGGRERDLVAGRVPNRQARPSRATGR